MAKVSIGCCWGKAKYEFRRSINCQSDGFAQLKAEVGKALQAVMYCSRDGKTMRDAPLPFVRVRKFSRHARAIAMHIGHADARKTCAWLQSTEV